VSGHKHRYVDTPPAAGPTPQLFDGTQADEDEAQRTPSEETPRPLTIDVRQAGVLPFVERYRAGGGSGPTVAAVKVCWDSDEERARKQAHALWPTDCLPGQLNQELAMPAHFEQASSLVTEDMVAEKIPCGPDPDRHAESIRQYVDAGFDEIYINQVGDNLDGFLEFWDSELQGRIGL
jgi:G6PDH family F420-dependent oxidoreductase